MHAPGYQDWPMAIRASHHLLLSHGLAVDAFRAVAPKHHQVGITLNFSGVDPASDSEADQAAARRFDGWHHRWFMDPLFKGQYPADMVAFWSEQESLDYILPEDLAVIGRPIDFLGVNYYTRAVVRANPKSHWLGGIQVLPPSAPVTDQNWEIVPEYLFKMLTRIGQEWTQIPLYLHENGCAMPDQVNEAGQVEDTRRLEYLRDHIAQGHRAIGAGVNLKGWYVWSLLDNFEWAWGYGKRFGIVRVDYETQRRIPKASALWYRDVIARNGL